MTKRIPRVISWPAIPWAMGCPHLKNDRDQMVPHSAFITMAEDYASVVEEIARHPMFDEVSHHA